MKKSFLRYLIIFLFCIVCSFSAVRAEDKTSVSLYPDYSQTYVGEDKFENFNRKMFIFNGALNKFLIRPIHILWASIIPKYGMDRIQNIYTNIEYPKRLISSLIQKDFETSKNETLRFLTNTTIGLGGLFDPAAYFFDIKPAKEDMEQALNKCKISSGPYLCVPVVSGTTPRELVSKALECPLDPAFYVASPITILVKSGLLINRTAYMQPFSQMLETTYADPYEITKKLYGIEKYIRSRNLDRTALLDTNAEILKSSTSDEINMTENNKKSQQLAQSFVSPLLNENKNTKQEPSFLLDIVPNCQNLKADIILSDFNPQDPVTDSMRTALFDLPEIKESIWSEISLWNRSFNNRIKTASISVDENKDEYDYRFIMQKDKSAPVAILYPSFGESVYAHHNVVFAKILFDEGYSVVMQGSPFHWSFVNSMPDGYVPGILSTDADYLKLVTQKILAKLEKRYECKFDKKIIIGTSFGALTALFVGEKEFKNDTFGLSQVIAINPPLNMFYALRQLDSYATVHSNSDEMKHQIATTAAKVIQLFEQKENENFVFSKLPFSPTESRLITSFIMRQKLSDTLFCLEKIPQTRKTDFYQKINNLSFLGYAKQYLAQNDDTLLQKIESDSTIFQLNEYLAKSDKYKIYHTLDDFYVAQNDLIKLKEISKNKITFINNGSHLGFLYRAEFLDSLKNDLKLKEYLSLLKALF